MKGCSKRGEQTGKQARCEAQMQDLAPRCKRQSAVRRLSAPAGST